jgi:type VI secretion system protein ImpH
MSAKNRSIDQSILEEKQLSDKDYQFLQQLQATPYNFDFFQAVRRLECIYDKQLGHSSKPSDDPVRLMHEGHISFAPSTLSSFSPQTEDNIARLGSYFLGLLGPQGPMPMYFTEYAQARKIHSHDETLIHFLDLFHHRMLSFFYRAWADNQPVVNLDQPDVDKFKNYLGSFFGLGDTVFHHRDTLSDNNKLFMSGHLSCQTKHVQGLESLMTSFFCLPVKIKEFMGECIRIPADSLCQLGLGKETSTLGDNVIVGSKIWEAHQKFRIIIGPLSYDEYQQFLPDNPSLRIVVDMVKNYIGDIFNWDLQLILQKQQVPALCLTGQQQLGYTTWSLINNKHQDADELIFTPSIMVNKLVQV